MRLKGNAENIAFRLRTFCVYEADVEKFMPKLHMNSDGLVLEYNEKGTGYKRFEKIAGVEKNNS
jgi:hypothetical protein